MKNNGLRTLIPWISGILIFLIVSLLFFSPVLEGKKLRQDDISRHKGVSKEIADYRAATGKEALWTNSMFGGMPAYQISTLFHGNLTRFIDKILQLGLPHPANYVFLYALGFFILLLVLGVNPWLSVAGALGFAFSSYFFIIIEAGHNSKAHAIAYMAPVVAGFILTYKGKYLTGGILTSLFLALEIGANHLQITYYLFLTLALFVLFYLFSAIRDKSLPAFIKSSAVLFIAGILAIGPNLSALWTTYEYSKYTTRGKSELTSDKENKTTGLDRDYVTDWSYGPDETLTLLIPNFKGGSSQSSLSTNSHLFKTLQSNNIPNAEEIIKYLPLYWGPQRFTSGPVYAGAILVFLFVLGLIIVKGPVKWWLAAATLLSVLLSWGHFFNGLTNFFLDYVPGYNKFRAVSMTLVIAEFCIPLLGILALNTIAVGGIDRKKTFNALKTAFIITGGICLFFALFPGMFYNFVSAGDAELKQSGYPDWFTGTLPLDRKSLLQSDAFRSLVFIVLGGVAVWAVIFNKVRKEYAFAAITLLILIDLWAVNKRYLHEDKFVRKSEVMNPFPATQADEFILKDKDPDFRVLNVTVNTFNDASTSYYHKSVGGYHGAKLKRYQELIEHQLSNNNLAVINMLNTKYVIVRGTDNQPVAQPNMQALGNAWFVDSLMVVKNADSELEALKSFNPARTAVVDQRFKDQVSGFVPGRLDSLSSIRLTDYKPNHLTYEYQSAAEQMAVFSEIYYDKGWKAYVDGKPMPHFRVNYVLRAMMLPAGGKKVEFKFEPKSYFTGEKISYASSVVLFLVLAGALVYEIIRRRKGGASSQ